MVDASLLAWVAVAQAILLLALGLLALTDAVLRVRRRRADRRVESVVGTLLAALSRAAGGEAAGP